MAENQADNDNSPAVEPSSGGGLLGTVGSALSGAASLFGKAWNAVMADGTIEAAWRQGSDEIGEALKAFPDSIQVSEPGSINNPTQGEIAADRADTSGREMWPSEIAAQNRNQPVSGNDYGRDAGYSM